MITTLAMASSVLHGEMSALHGSAGRSIAGLTDVLLSGWRTRGELADAARATLADVEPYPTKHSASAANP